MSTRKQREKSVKTPKKPRPFAFQAYVEQEENRQTIRDAAARREMSVTQFLVYSALKEAKSA